MSYTINLEKESFKFSGTHFTIFGPKVAERMHGHNFQVRVKLHVTQLDKDLGMAFDFNAVKPIIKTICSELDEYVLVPIRSPYLEVSEKGGQTEIKFADKFYSLPKADIKPLPLVNITSEQLACYFAEELETRLFDIVTCEHISITIEETRGQSVTYRL